MEHEEELQRLREENSELKKRVADFSVVEAAKKKLDAKVEQLEQKACPKSTPLTLHSHSQNRWTT